jgi:signal transduction histidine kinase
MLDYLIEWSRIRYASEAYNPTKVELDDYVKRAFWNLSEKADSLNIHLQKQIEEGILVYADSEMLLSILQNLITFSLEASMPGGEIIVSADKTNEIIIRIKGTSMEIQPALIEKHLNTPSNEILTAMKENEGASLRLLISKSFIEKNGGQIHSESSDRSITFYFNVPSN